MCKRIFTSIKIGHKYVFLINYSGCFNQQLKISSHSCDKKKLTTHILKSKCVNRFHNKTRRFFLNAPMCKLELWSGLGKADAEIYVIAHTTCLQICQKRAATFHQLEVHCSLLSPILQFIIITLSISPSSGNLRVLFNDQCVLDCFFNMTHFLLATEQERSALED